MKKRKKFTLLTQTDKTGLLFVLPFIIGFIWLFFKPLLESLNYSFYEITVGSEGLIQKPIGFYNWNYMFTTDIDFIKDLLTMSGEMLIKILVIMFISMFLAVLLVDKFPGRLLFRTCLFLPMIFGAAPILDAFSKLGGSNEMAETSNAFVTMSGEMSGFVQEIISSFGILTPLIEKFTVYAGTLFNLMWSTALQIIIFIIGLQAIPSHLYEVAKMEGATKWETFWKITFPLLSPSILLCLIYSIIDYFNASTNPVVMLIDERMIGNLGYACAMSWAYSVLIFAIVILVNAVVSRKIITMD
ncbi:MAG: sugar ABC transporter permease [Oscillospiraceae bacterium]|nr:sugar ABC transporter permease [Oscillospiraceae bacterium]